jgi:hypothetical protein
MNRMNEKFMEFAPLEEYHSIDESMIPYCGTTSCKQFIRRKPIRWGLGYIIWFDPYQGASATLPDKYKIWV